MGRVGGEEPAKPWGPQDHAVGGFDFALSDRGPTAGLRADSLGSKGEVGRPGRRLLQESVGSPTSQTLDLRDLLTQAWSWRYRFSIRRALRTKLTGATWCVCSGVFVCVHTLMWLEAKARPQGRHEGRGEHWQSGAKGAALGVDEGHTGVGVRQLGLHLGVTLDNQGQPQPL